MQDYRRSFPASPPTLTLQEVERWADDYHEEIRFRTQSKNTVQAYRSATTKLVWFLRQEEAAVCGRSELRRFFTYVANGHESPGGRWGNERQQKPTKPHTAHTYFERLRGFFNYLVEQRVLEASPLADLKAPVYRPDQVQPFTDEDITALLEAARRARYGVRDTALLLFLLDTGARASETIALRWREVDLHNRQARVLGKGGKERSLPLGRSLTRALWALQRERTPNDAEAVFLTERGRHEDPGPLTRGGLAEVVERLGKAAGITRARCSPHTFRHTMAISFLRSGGNVYSLKLLLGHTSLKQVSHYLALAEADVASQHAIHSPADRLTRGKAR